MATFFKAGSAEDLSEKMKKVLSEDEIIFSDEELLSKNRDVQKNLGEFILNMLNETLKNVSPIRKVGGILNQTILNLQCGENLNLEKFYSKLEKVFTPSIFEKNERKSTVTEENEYLKIPVYQPELSGNEKIYVNECLNTNWISSQGKFVRKFEDSFSSYLNVNHAIAVSNGTVALHLALMSLGIGEGDEVICPTLTYIASANAIRYTGATPIFADSLKDSWQIDPCDIERKITDKTRAIMPVHLYGQVCDMQKIVGIAEKYDLFVIEDCAESFGSKFKNNYAGSFGDISAFSFYGNKTITCGEGGMVVTNNETLYNRAFHLKSQGVTNHRQYWHDVIGYNYRMTNICAAIGLAQLEKADDFIFRKRQLAKWYMEFLKNVPVTFQSESQNTFHTYWMISILVPKSNQRDELRQFLQSHGIETRPLFYPVHTMPMYSKKYQKFITAEDISSRGINLPSYPALSREEVKFICEMIIKFFKNTFAER